MLLNLQVKCCLLFAGLNLEDHSSGCFLSQCIPATLAQACYFHLAAHVVLLPVLICVNVVVSVVFLVSEELQIVQKVVGQFICPDVEQSKTPLKCWCLAKESCKFSLAFQIKNKEQTKKLK